tara:strand:+ start:141 stop:518 length:378 start_codon:yes stop_codon:yes gene_type:complete
MTNDAKYRFLSKLEQLAEELYRHGDSINHGDAWELQRSFLWGYGDAGKTINLVTSEDIQKVIDRAHERVYGESRVCRIERLKPLENESGEPDWDAFDSPTWERRQGSTKGWNSKVGVRSTKATIL